MRTGLDVDRLLIQSFATPAPTHASETLFLCALHWVTCLPCILLSYASLHDPGRGSSAAPLQVWTSPRLMGFLLSDFSSFLSFSSFFIVFFSFLFFFFMFSFFHFFSFFFFSLFFFIFHQFSSFSTFFFICPQIY